VGIKVNGKFSRNLKLLQNICITPISTFIPFAGRINAEVLLLGQSLSLTSSRIGESDRLIMHRDQRSFNSEILLALKAGLETGYPIGAAFMVKQWELRHSIWQLTGNSISAICV